MPLTRAISLTMGSNSSSVQCSKTPLLHTASTALSGHGSGRVRSQSVRPGGGRPETRNSSAARSRIAWLKSHNSMTRPAVASSADSVPDPHPASNSTSPGLVKPASAWATGLDSPFTGETGVRQTRSQAAATGGLVKSEALLVSSGEASGSDAPPSPRKSNTISRSFSRRQWNCERKWPRNPV